MKGIAKTLLVALFVLGLPGPARSLEGWLLLVPPVDQGKLQGETTGSSASPAEALVAAVGGAFLLPAAPLREWEQFHAFDSAAACEQWRAGLQEDAERRLEAVRRPQDGGPDPSFGELLFFIRLSQGMESRCLPVSVVFPPKS